MKKFLSVLIFMGLSIVSSFGQEQPRSERPPDITGSSGYSVGINTQFMLDGLFDQNTITPLELMVRKRTKGGQAIRGRIRGMSRYNELKRLDEIVQTISVQLSVALGYEWGAAINNKFGYYYGLDFESGWKNEKIIRDFVSPSSTWGEVLVETTNLSKPHTIGILPLIGFSYSPFSKLSISFETHFENVFIKEKMKSTSIFAPVGDPNNIMEGSWGGYTQKTSKFNFQPYSGIFVNLNL
nr:hypothetical protein [Cytophagales bacterium]